MNSFYYRSVETTEAESTKYVSVNNYGYHEGITNMKVCRESGRVDYQLIYVKKGELVIKEGDKEILSKEGTVCLFRPREEQTYSVNGVETTYFWIHFSGSETERMLDFFKEKSSFVGAFPEFEYYCQTHLNDCLAYGDFFELLLEGRLIALFARLAEKIKHNDKKDEKYKISPALDAIHKDSTKRLSNEELSRLCGLSNDYFLKIFKRTMKTSPQHYYTLRVIDKARYLLENSSYNISEISVLCGIDDSLYFSRLFKKHVGLSPRDYRKG